MRRKTIRLLNQFSLALLLLSGSIEAVNAFPELSRHGYASCTACHVSPNGGGVLTPYGRGLARELLSTWGTPREAEIGHGILPKDWSDALEQSKLRLGGDARWVQTHRENSTVRAGQFFTMQAQAELAWDEGAWAVAATLGRIEDPRGKKDFRLTSPRYYGLLRFAEAGNIRVGRFTPAFGLHLSDHTLSVRRGIGLGPDSERDNVELSWIGELHQTFATISQTESKDRELSASVRYERIIKNNSRLGISLWNGRGSDASSSMGFDRWIVGIHSIANLARQWFLSAEFDRVMRQGASRVDSQFAFVRLNYEPVQGIWPFLQWQYEMGDLKSTSSEINKLGLGVNFFPRPHFELLGIWNRVQRSSETSDEAYLMLHYYL